jgi:hypothetical protein
MEAGTRVAIRLVATERTSAYRISTVTGCAETGPRIAGTLGESLLKKASGCRSRYVPVTTYLPGAPNEYPQARERSSLFIQDTISFLLTDSPGESVTKDRGRSVWPTIRPRGTQQERRLSRLSKGRVPLQAMASRCPLAGSRSLRTSRRVPSGQR